MELNRIFINKQGLLRSGWRLLVFAFVLLAVNLVLTTLIRAAYLLAVRLFPGRESGDLFQDFIFRLSLVVASLIAAWICTRLLDRLPWRAIGLWFHSRWFRDFLIGSLIGIASLALATAIAAAGGGLQFTMAAPELFSAVIKTLVLSAILFIAAALAEEALFRGYPLQTFTRAGLFWVGALVTSLLFLGVHLGNPNFKPGIPVLNLIIAGIWFALGYLRTRSLWFPLGLHWAWNWALGSLFGLPVSGITKIAPNPLFRGTDLGPAWLTGGDYGIEGGIACTIALLVSSLVVWEIKWVNVAPEMIPLSSLEGVPAIARGSDQIEQVVPDKR